MFRPHRRQNSEAIEMLRIRICLNRMNSANGVVMRQGPRKVRLLQMLKLPHVKTTLGAIRVIPGRILPNIEVKYESFWTRPCGVIALDGLEKRGMVGKSLL